MYKLLDQIILKNQSRDEDTNCTCGMRAGVINFLVFFDSATVQSGIWFPTFR